MAKRVEKCFYCGGNFENEIDIIEFKVPYTSGRTARRKFHEKCLPEFKKILEEQGGEIDSVAYRKKLNARKTAQKKPICTYCGRLFVDDEKSLVLYNQFGNSYGKYHPDCYIKYINAMQDADARKLENKEWEEVYDYFAYEILNMRSTQMRENKAIVYRLAALRIGKKRLNKGDIVMGVEAGYSYKTILYTMKFVKTQITEEFASRKFHDMNHKINYAMLIIWNNIDFINGRVKSMERQKELTEIETKKRLEEKERLKNIEKAPYKRKSKTGGKSKWAWLEEDE